MHPEIDLSVLRQQLQVAIAADCTGFVMDPKVALDLVERCQDAEDEVVELEREVSRQDEEIQELVGQLQGGDTVWSSDGVN